MNEVRSILGTIFGFYGGGDTAVMRGDIELMSPPINTLSPHHMGGGGTNPPMCKWPRESPGYIYIW